MLVVLNIRYSLCKVTIGTNSGGIEAVLDLTEKLFNNGYSVLTDNDSFHFLSFAVSIPFMVSNISDGKSLDGISIEYFLDKFF